MDYCSPQSASFSLTRVPKNVEWDHAWSPSALSYEGCPILVRVVGDVRGWQVVQREEEGQRLSLELDMVRGVDEDALMDMLQRGTKALGKDAAEERMNADTKQVRRGHPCQFPTAPNRGRT